MATNQHNCAPRRYAPVGVLGRRLEQTAQQLDRACDELRARAGACQWHSPASLQFSAALQNLLGACHRVADKLRDTAAVQHHHEDTAAQRARAAAHLAATVGSSVGLAPIVELL